MKLVPAASKKTPAVRILKKWHKVFLVVFAALVVAAVIAVTLVLTLQSSTPADNARTSLVLPRVAITNLSLVNGHTDDDTKDTCVQLGWIPTGVKWVASSGDPGSYMCVQQSSPVNQTVIVNNADTIR
ncbi:hypothetical protein ON010_g18004 [Phytophthora cinnamomi]|nr:hypothetical protein ON010_g18004 [Phytophthora cinnamomi]